jgi:hypothetical protein
VLIAVVVGLALLIGGLTQVSRQSKGYDANTNRSLVAQGSVVADESNATAVQVRTLMNGIPGQIRQNLQADLDGAVQQTADEADRAALAAGSAQTGSVAGDFAVVFADRAEAMTELRSAIDGFLGMEPTPVSGDPGTTGTATALPPLLSATTTTNRIAAAGALLSHADGLYRSVRATFSGDSGHGRLPRSTWVTDPQQWQLGTVAARVDLIATSPTLTASHYLVLRTVRLSPPALPAAPGTPAGTSVLSPTTQLGVTVVLTNQGTADEPGATVRFTIANQSTGATTSRSETTALASGGSVTLPTVNFGVKPGTAYVVTESVVPPAGQADLSGASAQQALQVAPAT